jgi:predicted nucleic acid-binding protein
VDLVIDASIVFTAIAGKGVTKEIIFLDALKLHAPEHLADEIEEHKIGLIEIAGLSESETDNLLGIIKGRIAFVTKEQFERFLDKANSLIPDKDDTEYLALSLSMNGIPIWSNDDHFKKQNFVEAFTTSELVSELKVKGILS